MRESGIRHRTGQNESGPASVGSKQEIIRQSTMKCSSTAGPFNTHPGRTKPELHSRITERFPRNALLSMPRCQDQPCHWNPERSSPVR